MKMNSVRFINWSGVNDDHSPALIDEAEEAENSVFHLKSHLFTEEEPGPDVFSHLLRM